MKLLFLQESPMYEALGIHALAGVVKGGGHQADLLIESEERYFTDKIREIRPDLLAFSFMTRQQEWAINTINRVRRAVDIPILIGGTHPTMYPETLGHCDADCLCVGEGEGPILDLLNRLEDGGSIDNIPNIHIRKNGSIVRNEIRKLSESWDDFPLPDRTVYWRYPFLQTLPLKRFVTSIGCAYKCSFCYINNYRKLYAGAGKFFRRKSISRVLAEMKDVRERYPLKRVHFVDDIFSLDKRWVQEFLPVFWKEIRMPWSANIWIEHMTEDTVALFKEHGCVGLTFGVESGNERTRLELIDKRLPNRVYEEHCGHLKKYRIAFHTGNIIGLPGEGLEEAFETARFNHKIGVTSARSAMFWPFPGTQLTKYAQDHGMLASDYSVEYFNRGIYPIVTHKDSEKLKILNNMFHLVVKYPWLERILRILLKWPKNPIVQAISALVNKSFWYAETKFFGLLNIDGFIYWFHLRKSLASLHRYAPDPRFQKDADAQRPFWNMNPADIDRVYATNRDGLT